MFFLWRHAEQDGQADQPLHCCALLAKLEPEDAIAKGAAHARVEGEPVGGGRLAQTRSASDARHGARTDDAHHRAIASDAAHEGIAQVPLLWARHVVGRQRWHVVQRRRFEAKELGRPGGEAAARGSRVVEEAVRGLVHECSVLRINVELKLLHLSAEAIIQVPGLRLGADRGARLLKGHRRLGSRRDRLGPRLGLGLGVGLGLGLEVGLGIG